MTLKIGFEGLRFRKTDGTFTTLKASVKLRLAGQRQSNPTVIRLRAGDNPADLAQIVNRRERVSALAPTRTAKIELPEMIDDPRLSFKVAKDVMVESLSEGRALAEELNRQHPGRKFRIPTESELLKLNELLEDQLEGVEKWIWTETEDKDYPGKFVLRSLGIDGRTRELPAKIYLTVAIRFVEDR